MLFTGENVQVDQLNMFCASYVEEEETNMKKNLLGKMVITGIISAAMLASTAASTWAAESCHCKVSLHESGGSAF